jgi:hypothetical protein
MKFEMEFGWTGNEKITVETYDFNKIKAVQAFIEHCETFGWDENIEDFDDLEDDEEDTEDEELVDPE